MNKVNIVQHLKHVRDTKSASVYANEHFSALYIPKYLLGDTTDVPKEITITIEEKEKVHA